MISTTSTSCLLTAIRILTATLLLAGALSFAPNAGATGCHPSTVSLNGGTRSNTTTVNVSANGGRATSNAQGGNGNTARATAEANGGTITVGTVDSGGNTGNVIETGL